MIFKKKTVKKNLYKSEPISYSTEFRVNNNLNNFVGKLFAVKINAFQGVERRSYQRRFQMGGVTPLQLAYLVKGVYVPQLLCTTPSTPSVCRRITFFAIQVDVYKK